MLQQDPSHRLLQNPDSVERCQTDSRLPGRGNFLPVKDSLREDLARIGSRYFLRASECAEYRKFSILLLWMLRKENSFPANHGSSSLQSHCTPQGFHIS